MNLYKRVDHIAKNCSKRNLNCLDELASGGRISIIQDGRKIV